MADWGAFAGFLAVISVLLLLLARASSRLFEDAPVTPSAGATDGFPSGGAALLADYHPEGRVRLVGDAVGPYGFGAVPRRPTAGPDLTTRVLLANVVLTHGLFAGLVLAAVGLTRVPVSALGIAVPTPGVVLLGVGFGVALWAGNEGVARWLDVAGIERSEALRAAMAPDSRAGWLALYLLVLPLVAGFEELLFRGAMVGALSVGYPVSPWVLAVGSSALFAYGHGAQGSAGMVVTGMLGLALAGGFVLTGSLAVVLVAHYVVNALEFGLYELAPRVGARGPAAG